MTGCQEVVAFAEQIASRLPRLWHKIIQCRDAAGVPQRPGSCACFLLRAARFVLRAARFLRAPAQAFRFAWRQPWPLLADPVGQFG